MHAHIKTDNYADFEAKETFEEVQLVHNFEFWLQSSNFVPVKLSSFKAHSR